MSEKAEKNITLTGSLAFRVLFINLLFVIFPLIVYTGISFQKSYTHEVDVVYQDLRIVEHEQQRYIKQLIDFHIDFLAILEGFYEIIDQYPDVAKNETEKVNALLDQFSHDVDVAAILRLSLDKNGRLICEKSTLPAYKGKDFSQHFARAHGLREKNTVFFSSDPEFGNSLYINHFIYDSSGKNVVKVLSSVIPIGQFVNNLSSIKQSFLTNISVINKDNHIIGTTEPSYQNKDVELVYTETPAKEDVITLLRSKDRERGVSFEQNDEKRYAVVTQIPYTQAHIMSSIPRRVVMEQMNTFLINMAILFLSLLLIGGALSVVFTLRMSRPLKQIIRLMQEVAEGYRENRFVKDPMGFEMNVVGRQLNETLDALERHIVQEQEEKTQKELWQRELQIGHEIQKSILPSEKFNFPGIDLSYSFTPAKVVAGDFYDWMVKDDKLLIIIADGVGKGISGCLYAFDLRSILKTYAMQEKDLLSIIQQTNKLFLEDTKDTGSFVTAFLLLYDRKTGKLNYANCGHTYPIIKKSNQETTVLKSAGMAFGLSDNMQVEIKELELEEGDNLFLYTDGVTDTQDPDEEFLGLDRFVEFVQATKGSSTEELLNELHQDLDRFINGQVLYDDMTLIVLHKTSNEE